MNLAEPLPAPPTRPVTDVAVGLVHAADGSVLLCRRPEPKPYAGWWEFPGGKFEAGEDAHVALRRELHEELGIDVHGTEGWVVREHDYEHAYVRLHFRRVVRWSGTPQPREGQVLHWCDPLHVDVAPLLPASLQPVRWLGLPTRYAITDAADRGVDALLAGIDAHGVPAPLVLMREPSLAPAEAQRLFDALLPRVRAAGARLLVSSRHPASWWPLADGVHLTGRDVAERAAGQIAGQVAASPGARPDEPAAGRCGTQPRPALPDGALLFASCHDADGLRQAARLGCDAAVLGPVLATASHPGRAGIGWPAFERLAGSAPLPCYALGGLALTDGCTAQARAASAHGVAARSAAWRPQP